MYHTNGKGMVVVTARNGWTVTWWRKHPDIKQSVKTQECTAVAKTRDELIEVLSLAAKEIEAVEHDILTGKIP